MRRGNSEPASSSGPPSYEAIAQRFSSYPKPLAYFRTLRAEAAKERGEFVGIHDSIRADPKDYDALITDVNHNTLETDIAQKVGIKYLQEATKEEADEKIEIGDAFFHGINS